MIALVPVRAGVLPAGAVEAAEESAGRVMVAGGGTEEAATALAAGSGGRLERVERAELGSYAPARWARLLAPLLEGHDVVVLPAVPDGRDLAPRLAVALDRPLVAGAASVRHGGATLVRHNGSQNVEVELGRPFVATLLPAPRGAATTAGRRGASRRGGEGPFEHGVGDGAGSLAPATIDLTPALSGAAGEAETPEATSFGVLDPGPSVADLAEAERIVAGGAGLGGEAEFALLFGLGELLAASVGATRVVTDAGIVSHDRQIGTTGVSVRPRLYVAFGISGAAQHVGGLGEPEHVVSVNVDPSSPMMAMADLAIVSDARATLEALVARLIERNTGAGAVRPEEAFGG